jgi:hypothetical protein
MFRNFLALNRPSLGLILVDKNVLFLKVKDHTLRAVLSLFLFFFLLSGHFLSGYDITGYN